MLAGISATWYTYLEQARDIKVSEQVLNALANTLNLHSQERVHLFQLAHGSTPARGTAPPEQLEPPVKRLPRLLEPNPAYITGARYDLLGWNAAAAALFTDFSQLPRRHRNLAWWVFTDPAAREVLVEWEREAQGLLARLRAATGRHPGQPLFDELVADLHAHSTEVRDWWPRHDVRASGTGTKRLRHPRLGAITLDHTVLQVADAPDQQLAVYSAEAGSKDAAALAQLSAVIPA